MSEHVIYKCETCGTTTENRFSSKGWVNIDGSVSVAAGFYDGSSHRTAYLDARRRDFCSVTCFIAKIAEIMPLQKEPSE